MADTYMKIVSWSSLPDRTPVVVCVEEVDLVVIRYGSEVAVLEGRCPHRGALLSCAAVEGDDLVCGEHGWDFRLSDGQSSCIPGEGVQKFPAKVSAEDDAVLVDATAVESWKLANPSAFHRGELDGEL